MTTVDLFQLTQGEVRMLTGAPRGVQARTLYSLDEVEAQADAEPIVITAPTDLDTVTPSFVQGFLARSVKSLGVERFQKLYDLTSLSEDIRNDFKIGIDRLIRNASSPKSSILT